MKSMLLQIDDIYKDIEGYEYSDETSNSEYFLKSIDYYHLELSMLFEQNYLVTKVLLESDNKLSVKKTDKEEFKHLQWCICEIGAFQNRFIIGKSEIIELYNKDRFMIDDIKTILLMMNLMRYCIVQMIQSALNVDVQQLMCPESERFFKGYFGEGQHIERNKEWNSIKLKDFRDMYVPDIPLR